MVHVLALVALHHDYRVAAILFVEAAASGVCTESAISRVVVVSVVLDMTAKEENESEAV